MGFMSRPRGRRWVGDPKWTALATGDLIAKGAFCFVGSGKELRKGRMAAGKFKLNVSTIGEHKTSLWIALLYMGFLMGHGYRELSCHTRRSPVSVNSENAGKGYRLLRSGRVESCRVVHVVVVYFKSRVACSGCFVLMWAFLFVAC